MAFKIRLTIFIITVVFIISCSSSSKTTRKWKKEGQCDCPKTEKVRKPAKHN